MTKLLHPQASHVVSFTIPKSLEKKDWLMCPACNLPQFLHEGCCLDPDCDPHTFRVDWGCVHCGCPIDANAESAAHYEVVAGKASRRRAPWRKMQKGAIRQYNSESVSTR